MQTSVEREKVRFESGAETCVGWHYRGTNGGCVVMAAGGGVIKEPGTDLFAERFRSAGFSVLAFDYRRLGESGGWPRQIIRVGEQLDDWQAAIEFAAKLSEVDPAKLAIWGYSLSGGHVFRVAARNPQLAAAIAHAPLADGQAAMPNAIRHQTPLGTLRLTGRGLLDAAGGVFGRDPLTVPLAARPGTAATLSTPDSLDADRALKRPEYPEWCQEIPARSALRIGFYRPGRQAVRVKCPLLVMVHDQDRSALAAPAVGGAQRAPRAEVEHLPGGHYGGYLDAHEQAVRVQLAFLERHVQHRRERDPIAANTDRALAETG
jgi:uncharacterized protein